MISEILFINGNTKFVIIAFQASRIIILQNHEMKKILMGFVTE